MAHFARIENLIVTDVIFVSNENINDENGSESETVGIQFCNSLIAGDWIQTSYNGNIRKNFAGIGYTYDSERDAFIPPKLYHSWTLNEQTCQWEAPIPYPNDNKLYVWNENQKAWEEVVL